MIAVPLYAALFLFLLWTIIFIIFFLLNIYHLAKSASLTFTSFLVTCFIAASAACILFGTWFFLQGTDWQTTIISFTSFGV